MVGRVAGTIHGAQRRAGRGEALAVGDRLVAGGDVGGRAWIGRVRGRGREFVDLGGGAEGEGVTEAEGVVGVVVRDEDGVDGEGVGGEVL